jgi:hypothetical protein
MIRLGLLGIAAALTAGVPVLEAADPVDSSVTEPTDTGSDTGADIGTDAGAGTDTDAGIDTGTDTDTDTGTDTNTGTDTDTDIGTDADTGADTGTDTDADTEEVYECTTTSSVYWIKDGETIQDGANKYGDIYLSVDKGHVGDEVTAIVAGNPTMDMSSKVVTLYRYTLSYVTLNGVKIDGSDGEYKFNLVEGVNDVKAYFSGRTEISVMDLSSINWKSLLTVDNLLKLIYFVITLFLSSGFFITLIKTKKYQQKTQAEITNTVQGSANEVISSFMKNTVQPLLEKQSEQTTSSNDTAKTLMRVVTYALSGTSEDRLAALKEMQSLGTNDEKLNEQIQAIVKQSMEDAEKKKSDKAKAIEEAKESVNSLTGDNNTDGGEYGTI